MRVNGATANMFQKNAIGKFFNTVPIQMTGRSMNDRWAKMTLNRMEAARLFAGHMNATVPQLPEIRRIILCGMPHHEAGADPVAEQFGDDEDDDAHIGCFL